MVGVLPRRTALAEESAEVEVLFANMDKMQAITKKIQGSLNRLESSGKSVKESIGPIYGNTQKLQVVNSNVDRIIDAIDRIREPLDQRGREERIIRAGPRKVPLQDFLASLDRTTLALRDLKRSNLRSNQQAVAELGSLLRLGARQLEDSFRDVLRESAAPSVEPLEYVAKNNPFPLIAEAQLSTLRLINANVFSVFAQLSQGESRDTPTQRAYAEIRGDYMTRSLNNLAAASVSTARKVSPDALYQKRTNGIGTYAQAMEGLCLAEYENICPIFSRDEWSPVYVATCQKSVGDFAKTLRELNGHVQRNLLTDCFLGYEIIDVVSNLSLRVERKTGELKRQLYDAAKPIRDTSKVSLSKLLDDTKARIQTLVSLPADGGPVSLTRDVMIRLQLMATYLAPLSSVLASVGDGGWASNAAAASSASLATFDVGADGSKIFAHYAADTMDTLLGGLEARSRQLLKSKNVQGVFLANNVAIVDRMVRTSDLEGLVGRYQSKLEGWRKKATAMYLEAWREPSSQLLDVQYTNRSGRPHSGGAGPGESAAIVKALSSKDRDAIKDKLKSFNTSFEELVGRHRSHRMEEEVRAQLAREVQTIVEPLYGRFWDRYHEIDKGRGKHVKYDKAQLATALSSLG